MPHDAQNSKNIKVALLVFFFSLFKDAKKKAGWGKTVEVAVKKNSPPPFSL